MLLLTLWQYGTGQFSCGEFGMIKVISARYFSQLRDGDKLIFTDQDLAKLGREPHGYFWTALREAAHSAGFVLTIWRFELGKSWHVEVKARDQEPKMLKPDGTCPDCGEPAATIEKGASVLNDKNSVPTD